MKAGSKPAKPVKPASACPCGHALTYVDCCGRYHAGMTAPTPEALMRSRYSAYAMGLADYLLQTWANETRPDSNQFTQELTASLQPKWLGLEVLLQNSDGDAGTVEFIARCKINGRAEQLRERSRFVRRLHAGVPRWYYLDGEFPPPA